MILHAELKSIPNVKYIYIYIYIFKLNIYNCFIGGILSSHPKTYMNFYL